MSRMTDLQPRAAMRAARISEQLPCGTLFDTLLDQVADETPATDPEHQANCPHCRAAIAELTDIWMPVRELVQQPVNPPDTLTASVMERVVAIATHGWYAVIQDDPGVNRIAAWVVAVIARRAAASVTGVGAVRGQVTPMASSILDVRAEYEQSQPSPGQRTKAAGIGVAGRRVVVAITITAQRDQRLPLLAEQIRSAVTRHVRALTGLEVIAVDVEISDLDPLEAPLAPEMDRIDLTEK